MSGRRTTFLPRVMIAAEKSGQGKTLLTCILLSLLSDMGAEVQGFKCGPDYIDPMFHRYVTGRPSFNVDSFLAGEGNLAGILGRHGETSADRGRTCGRIALLEGVMGYYDGISGLTVCASSYEIARLTDTPVILIVDAAGRSLSALAALKGFLTYREDSRIRGVIFNRLSPMLYPGLKDEAERLLGVRVFGYVPGLKDVSLESRHLGLVMPEELPGFRGELMSLADRLRPGLDLEGICSLAKEAGPLSWEEQSGSVAFGGTKTPNSRESRAVSYVKKQNGRQPVIAVARDEAFCFYYEDNLQALRRAGAHLAFFSPLCDRALPERTDGLYLGGGYPELHAGKLSENKGMRESIRLALQAGLPCIAECGGYLYLKEWLADAKGRRWPMAGVLPGGSMDSGHLSHFGYGIMTLESDGLLGRKGDCFPVHEFHHWEAGTDGEAFFIKKPGRESGRRCGFMTDTLYAGFPHLYFYGSSMAQRFVEKAAGRIGREPGRGGSDRHEREEGTSF